MAIAPTQDQAVGLAQLAFDQPVYMLNLLKFKKNATYADGSDPDISGAKAYGRYGTEVRKLVEARGGTIVFGGSALHQLIGDGAQPPWDQVAVVMYPKKEALLEMTASAEYQAIHHHREAGLESQVLIACAAPPFA
jgi:uncharacterized protein (DUF1330 family)